MNQFAKKRDISFSDLLKVILENINQIFKHSLILTLIFIGLSFLIKPSFSTTSVLFPYKNASNMSSLLQSTIGIASMYPNQSDDLSRIYVDLFKSNDFIESTLNKVIFDRNNEESSIFDLKYSEELEEFNQDQINMIIYKSLIDNNLSVSYDSYTGLFYIELTFKDPKFNFNYHKQLIDSFDYYLSDLKNKKLILKTDALTIEQSNILLELERLEIIKKEFLENNRAILSSPNLSNELYKIEREIRLKESSYLAISNQIQMNRVDISMKGNNFRIIQAPVEPLGPNLTKVEISILGFLIGLSSSILFIFFKNYRKFL
ncbi:MAG: hypothetical protein L7V30_04775 [Gammaproteobacteria bacterium]|nr:hypothetical protein [Gammaproteobacteria bacterium]